MNTITLWSGEKSICKMDMDLMLRCMDKSMEISRKNTNSGDMVYEERYRVVSSPKIYIPSWKTTDHNKNCNATKRQILFWPCDNIWNIFVKNLELWNSVLFRPRGTTNKRIRMTPEIARKGGVRIKFIAEPLEESELLSGRMKEMTSFQERTPFVMGLGKNTPSSFRMSLHAPITQATREKKIRLNFIEEPEEEIEMLAGRMKEMPSFQHPVPFVRAIPDDKNTNTLSTFHLNLYGLVAASSDLRLVEGKPGYIRTKPMFK